MALRALILACLASATLTACGGQSDHNALVRAFTEADMEPETAECMADKAKDEMEPELYDALVEAAKSNDDSLDTLTTEQQTELAGYMFNAALACVPIEFE